MAANSPRSGLARPATPPRTATPYAGGLALATPFGVVTTTNITPDVETGIGAWSYPAFARAMRDGLHRDGRHLYPAFPYPSFAKTSEADLQALYAFLMSQPAVRQRNVASRLTFPFNLRPLMAGWNLLFNRRAISRRTRAARPSGIAGAISSMASAIAAPATRRAICSAPSAAPPISPAARRRAGRRRR